MTAAEAAAELLHRRTLRRSFKAWCEFVLEPLGQRPAAHHLLLIDALEALARGDINKLLVAMPPGSAKSTYVSTLFPPWWLAQDPTKSMIAASNTAELAERFGRRVRNTIQEHSAVLGYGVATDNAAAGRWETTRAGEYYAAGVMGTITGRRADLGVIDDAVKSRAEADSKLIRDKIWDWYRDDFTTRLKPGAKTAVVATRWNEDDLSGRLLEDMNTGGQAWHVLSLPMEAELNDPLGREPGERLWADWFTPQMVAMAKRDSRSWSSLYQQRPAPETGNYFKREYLRTVPTLPPRSSLRVFGASDYAVTADGGDWTCHVVVGVDSEDRLFVLDLWRAQASSDVWVESFCDLVIQWKPMGWAEEGGQIRASLGPWLDRRQHERRAYVARTQFPTRGDKAVRAQSIRGRAALCGLHIPVDAPWRAELEAEMMSFPASKYDDQVDALGLIGQMLDTMMGPSAAKPPPEPVDPWAIKFGKLRGRNDDGGWKVA
jgi:predicted phage terminase large subunit-like protein